MLAYKPIVIVTKSKCLALEDYKIWSNELNFSAVQDA